MRTAIHFFNSLILIFLLAMGSCKDNSPAADTIIHNARIWTANGDMPFAEAMALKGEIILAIGDKKEIMKYSNGNTAMLDMEKSFITPGFIDSHLHFLLGGKNLASVQLRDAKTPGEFKQRIKEYAERTEPGTWILGGEWDHKNWGGELPTKGWIDEFTPEHPVFISRLDGHMALANSLALELSGISRDTEDIEGGRIIRDSKGEPTGILKENAIDLVWKHIPDMSEQQLDTAMNMAMDYVASKGVCSVHHMAENMDSSLMLRDLETFHRAKAEGRLNTRIYTAYPISDIPGLEKIIEEKGYGDNWIKLGAVKGFIDGSLGSHTAAFFDPYKDKPGDKGFFVSSHKEIHDWIYNADKAGLQVIIHAIGDSAVNFLLNMYEQVGTENGERDRRFRVEHAQHLVQEDIGRFSNLNVIASMQPYHAIDDGRWAEKLIGADRIKLTHAYKSLLDSGAKLAFGSDWYVAPPDPLYGIYAAMTRRTLDDKNPGGWVPKQKISLEQALKAYTIDAAYASFDEDIKGSLEKGKLADFVVLDKDLFDCDPAEIKDVKVLQTWLGGKKIFDTN